MTLPAVTIQQLDGALGILPASAGRLFALVGPSSIGTANQPAAFSRIRDVQAAFGTGPLVEAAAHYIERYGRPVLLVRTGSSAAAAVSAITATATGSSAVTVAASPAPLDDYQLALRIVNGGTVGDAGITYQTSVDGGRTWSPVSALGTATTVAFPGAGVSFDLAAGDLDAGDLYTALATAAKWNATELGAALDALRNTLTAWEGVLIVGAVDADAFDLIEGRVAGMQAAGKHHWWVGNTRLPNAGETEAAYKTALEPLSAAKSSTLGSLYSGAAKLTSSVSGRKYRRPVAWAVAAREAASSEETNAANINLGPLPGVSIRDDNGNPDEHDEAVNPGLDDLRFGTLRTFDGLPGVYVTRARLFAPPTSDFQLLTYRRVMNLALDALQLYFLRRLNQQLLVSRTTGLILPSEANEIELGAEAALRAALLAKPKASGVSFKLSRTDNLLSTKTLTGEARILPLAYPEYINLQVGFVNPALQLQAA